MMSVGQAALVTSTADPNSGMGLVGFLVIAGLAVAVVFLYRSLRRQLGRIDFNAEGTSDAERMRGHGSPDGDTDARSSDA